MEPTSEIKTDLPSVSPPIEGMRPIIEMQFADFSSVGFNQKSKFSQQID